MTALAALSGALCGLGLVLVVMGIRGVDPTAAPRWRISRAQIDRAALRVCLALLAGVVVGVITGWPVMALATVALGLAGPRLLGTRGARERRVARLAAVASWAEMIRDTLSAGLGIETAIRASADAAPLPIRAEVELLAAELHGPEMLEDALRRFAGRVDNPTCDRVVAALLLPRGAGTLSQRLTAIAEAAQRDVDMRARVDAEREGTRWTARLVVVITAAMALGLALFSRDYLQPYGSAAGQLVLLLVVALFAVGYWWLGRISDEPSPPRLVVGEGVAP
ncbi:MAG: type II secretion system F family protein [Solirubrobacteraceae bacterium]